VNQLCDTDSAAKQQVPTAPSHYSTEEALRILQQSTINTECSDGTNTNEQGVQPPSTVFEPARLQSSLRTVSDSIIAPRPFTGRHNEDAEGWLQVFERYCTHRNLNAHEMKTLFPLMMRENSLNWIDTLPETAFRSYADLKEAFKGNYFEQPELNWQLQGNLWKESQRHDEKVEDFVTRIRRGALKLKFESSAICDIIINGLKPCLRMHVLLKTGNGAAPRLEDLVKSARLAEAVVVTAPDTSSNLLLEAMKLTAASNERQAKELQQLTSKVAALSELKEDQRVNAIQNSDSTPRKFYKSSPQRQQRTNWSQVSAGRSTEGGAKNFRESNNDSQQTKERCSRCGLSHGREPGVCAARREGVFCYVCKKPFHFSRCCPSRPEQQLRRQE
jgi:hypothetical protein